MPSVFRCVTDLSPNKARMPTSNDDGMEQRRRYEDIAIVFKNEAHTPMSDDTDTKTKRLPSQ
ncbi:MAG: hypothetical protein LKF61_06950 [Eggerthellaceae bacterium]|jgi:hypothetical protein|nr:hypothetical protein [Eggerthellaceae bacterium]MCH4220557.1 hypothetical protein [Eggerthellaceae bacterium]